MVDVLLPRPLPGAMGEPSKRRPGLALCAGCGGRIQDPFLLRVSPDLEWHVACLKCAECGQPLDETCTCFLRDGKAYCKRDYSRLFGIKCAQCRAAFSSSDLVMRARDHVYHLECFRCAACGRQLLPGDQFCLRERDLLCRADHGPPPGGGGGAGAAQQRLCEMLPSAGVYYFPWEINSSVPEGEALRTFGRLYCYDLVRSEAVLTAQHSSAQYRVCVDTEFVEPFQAQLGSCYIVLGEAEHREGEGLVVKARIFTCVEGMNVPLLEQAIQEQRKYFNERQERMGSSTS